MQKKFLLIILLFVFYSCKKEEGLGGLASVKGSISIQHLNCLLEKSGQSYPAVDWDVYIQYGSNNYISDKIETSPSGDFQFNYLTKGNYKIIVYCDDSLTFKGEKEIAIEKDVSINDKKATIDLGDITVYKHVDIDDGTARIKGTVMKFQYASGTTTVIDTIYAQDTDVYLMLNGSTDCYLDEKTLFDGSFVFNNIIPGDYTLFVYSEQPFSKEDIPIFEEFSVLESTTTIHLETIFVSDY